MSFSDISMSCSDKWADIGLSKWEGRPGRMVISQAEAQVESMYCLGGVGKLLIRSANSLKAIYMNLNIMNFVQLIQVGGQEKRDT